MTDELGQTVQERLALARVAYIRLELDEALRLYDDLLEAQPDLYDAHLGRARTLARMRRQEEAVAEAQRCIALDAERAQGHAALGMLRFLADELNEAHAALDQAVALDPDAADTYLTLSQVYADESEFGPAWEALEKARALIDAMPEGAERQQLVALAWHAQAYYHLSQGKNAEAIEAAQEVIALEEDSPYAACLAYSNIGILEARSRRYDVAIEYLDKAYTMNPYFSRAGNALGRLLILRRRFARAAEALGEIIARFPEEGGSTYHAYGMALARAGGRRAEALEQFRIARRKGLRNQVDALSSLWYMVWLSEWGRYTLVGLVLAAVAAWLILGQPSPQALTFLGILVLIMVLQRSWNQRKR
jgi:tetratricopeptide (TPR) repeat protein